MDFYGIGYSGKGEQKTISCPFHNEKTPSCKVHTGKKVFNCFGCGVGGNILNFITYVSSGYLLQDLDLNSGARFSGSPNDSNIVKDNVLNHPGNILNLPTYTISTTVPPKN